MTLPLRQHYSSSAGAPTSSSRHGMQQRHHRVNSSPGSVTTTSCGSSSAGAHPMYPSASPGMAVHRSHMGSGCGSAGHHPISRAPPQHMHNGDMLPPPMLSSSISVGNQPHPLSSPIYGSSAPVGGGGSSYFIDASPGYHGDGDDTRTPPTPMWASSLSLSPPSAAGGSGGGGRGSPPLHGIPGLGVTAGGPPGGLGYKERSRQGSLDEGRLLGGGAGGGCGGSRNVRCNSDSAQMLVSPGPGGGGGGNGGDEFSLDLKKVKFGGRLRGGKVNSSGGFEC